MHILPHNPVEILAPATYITRNDNPGVVPPWIVPTIPTSTNTGIVPPWMLSSVTAATAGNDNIGIVPPYIGDKLGDGATDGHGTNPGIVPPWLLGATA